MRSPALSLLLCASMLSALAPAPAWAAPSRKQRAEAKAHFERAAELYNQEDYAGAADEFEQAYELNPQVDTLFAWAQAERLAGDFSAAAELYQRLLDGELSDTQREAVQTVLAEVQAEFEAAEAAERERQEAAAAEAARLAAEEEAAEQAARDEADARERKQKRKRTVDLVLTGAGGALTAAGLGLVVGGGVVDGRVGAAQTYEEFEAVFDPGTGRGRGSIPLYAAGGAVTAVGLGLLITGVVRLVKHKREPSSVAFVPVLGPEQVGLSLSLRLDGSRLGRARHR